MASTTSGCGCPPTATPVSSGGVHHVFLTVNDLARSGRFYQALMPRLGYPGLTEYGAEAVLEIDGEGVVDCADIGQGDRVG